MMLWLWDNQLTSIESGHFVGLTNLTALGLSGNQLSSIESGDFDSEVLLGDVNQDGTVNGLDVDPFVTVLLDGHLRPTPPTQPSRWPLCRCLSRVPHSRRPDCRGWSPGVALVRPGPRLTVGPRRRTWWGRGALGVGMVVEVIDHALYLSHKYAWDTGE